MQKKTEPSQILFAALAPQTSELILHPHLSFLIPSFLQCQHLQAERDPDHSFPQGTQFPMHSASPPHSDHSSLWALSKAQAYQLASPESPQSGSSWQVQFTGKCGQMAAWMKRQPLFLVSPICQSGPKWGKVGRDGGGKRRGYFMGLKNNI